MSDITTYIKVPHASLSAHGTHSTLIAGNRIKVNIYIILYIIYLKFHEFLAANMTTKNVADLNTLNLHFNSEKLVAEKYNAF